MENEALEAVENAVDLGQDNPKTALIGAAVAGTVGLAVGLFVGYKAAMRSLESKYEERSDEEIAQAKAFYTTLHKKGDLSTPEGAVEALHPDESLEKAAEALTRYQGNDKAESELSDGVPEFITVEVEQSNVFEKSASTMVWDYEAERKQRSPDEPYVVHEDEWSEGKAGYERVTLTYYEGDDTLADEKDEPIPDMDAVIGLGNLDRFGHGTDDARTVFVRNDRLNIDFEVVKHDGKFAHEVLGFQHGELLASRDHHGVRKFSRFDE